MFLAVNLAHARQKDGGQLHDLAYALDLDHYSFPITKSKITSKKK